MPLCRRKKEAEQDGQKKKINNKGQEKKGEREVLQA